MHHITETDTLSPVPGRAGGGEGGDRPPQGACQTSPTCFDAYWTDDGDGHSPLHQGELAAAKAELAAAKAEIDRLKVRVRRRTLAWMQRGEMTETDTLSTAPGRAGGGEGGDRPPQGE